MKPQISRARGYLDRRGRALFVHCGISQGKSWGTYYRRSEISLQRLVSRHLPLRSTRDEAQRDLDRYAEQRGLEEIAVCRVCGCTDDNACLGGCYWVEDPEHIGDLCSSCLERVQRGEGGAS